MGFAPLCACVTKAKYDAQVRTAKHFKERAENCEAKSDKQTTQIGKLSKKSEGLELLGKKLKTTLDKCQETSEAAAARMKQLSANLEGLKKLLQNYQTLASKYKGKTKKSRKELARLKQEITAMQKHFSARMAATRKELAELAKARAKAEKRARMYRSLTRQFRKLIDAGTLSVGIVHGRMVIKLGSAVLFDSGKALLKASGKGVLDKVASVLKTVRRRHFQVAGHTDNKPIRFSKYRTNWDLSVARALQVVKYLQKQGVSPRSLSAGGFSQYQPVASNRTVRGRKVNRRIEISLLPSIPKHLLKR
jgi:chemotaxis protein MotB